jgi:hypothetical protein
MPANAAGRAVTAATNASAAGADSAYTFGRSRMPLRTTTYAAATSCVNVETVGTTVSAVAAKITATAAPPTDSADRPAACHATSPLANVTVAANAAIVFCQVAAWRIIPVMDGLAKRLRLLVSSRRAVNNDDVELGQLLPVTRADHTPDNDIVTVHLEFTPETHRLTLSSQLDPSLYVLHHAGIVVVDVDTIAHADPVRLRVAIDGILLSGRDLDNPDDPFGARGSCPLPPGCRGALATPTQVVAPWREGCNIQRNVRLHPSTLRDPGVFWQNKHGPGWFFDPAAGQPAVWRERALDSLFPGAGALPCVLFETASVPPYDMVATTLCTPRTSDVHVSAHDWLTDAPVAACVGVTLRLSVSR